MTRRQFAEAPVRVVRAGARIRALELDIGRDRPPDRQAIETICEQGLEGARFVGDGLELPAGAAAAHHFLEWIVCLRDLTASAVPVEWQASPTLAPLAAALRHLAPPAAGGIGAFEEWQRLHRYGICYWRSGPGFATIIDRRDEGRANQYILDTPEYLEIFRRSERVAERAGLDAVSSEALAALEADALILSLHGWSVALPFRMRHWPVPFTAI